MPLAQAVPFLRTIHLRPIGGQNNHDPAEELNPAQSPDMANLTVRSGLLLKRPGYAQLPAGGSAFATEVIGVYSTQDTENNTYLYAVTHTKVYRYNSVTEVWDEITGAGLAGGSLNMVSFENSQNSVIFANGVDKIQRIDFAGGTYATLNANAPICRYITRFANRVYAGFTIEGGATKPFRVRRSVASDHTDWVGIGSGFTDLDEFPYQIRNLKKLGTRLGVYTERSLILATRTEIAAAPARFDLTICDVGNYSPFTLQGWRDEHIFMGTDDFYSWSGTQPQELSLPVRDTIFDTINPGALFRNFALVRYDTKEYISFLCTTASTTPNIAWVYNKERGIWYPWTVSTARCGCEHRLDNTQTIDELIGTIDEQDWEFDTRDLESQFPVMLTGHIDGKVYIWSNQYRTDNGAIISCRWTSKDFTARDIDPSLANKKVTLKNLVVSYQDKGASFTLQFQYSTDGGASWTPTDSVVFTSTGSTSRMLDQLVTHQVTGNRVRFRILHESDSEVFALSSFHVDLEAIEAPLYS
jgi:hypothetical protein